MENKQEQFRQKSGCYNMAFRFSSAVDTIACRFSSPVDTMACRFSSPVDNMACRFSSPVYTIGLGRRVDIVDVIDYVNTSTCVKSK